MFGKTRKGSSTFVRSDHPTEKNDACHTKNIEATKEREKKV
jgi:hypothetical protein